MAVRSEDTKETRIIIHLTSKKVKRRHLFSNVLTEESVQDSFLLPSPEMFTHILCRAVHIDLYKKIANFNFSESTADDKRLTITSNLLKFTWVHIILFFVVSPLLKTYNPTLIFQTIFHHVFCKQVKWKKTFHEMEWKTSY